jgi:hypothetical protein
LKYLLQSIIWNCGEHIQPFFKGGKEDGNWRNLDIFFKPDEDCISSDPGQVTFSPGWFEQAHDVSTILWMTFIWLISHPSRAQLTIQSHLLLSGRKITKGLARPG